jgi:hypothetical protein
MGKLVESHGEITLIANQNLVSEWGFPRGFSSCVDRLATISRRQEIEKQSAREIRYQDFHCG